MVKIDGWNYVEEYFEESEENYWKMLLSKPEEKGYSETYIVNLIITADKLNVKGYEVPKMDHEKIENGEFEPGWHETHDVTFSRKEEEIAEEQDVKQWNLDTKNYVREVIHEIEE